MNTKILEYMIAIAETKSITRAAEQFYLSHPALSRHLKNIEAELGTPLFIRSSDGMQLTPAGIIFINDAQEILHIEKELNKDLAAMHQRQRNLLRVMIDNHFYNRFMRAVMPQFQTTHSDFTLELTKCNAALARRALREGQADLAFFDTVATSAAGLELLPVSRHELLLAFPKNYTGPVNVQGLRQAIDDGMFISLYPTDTTARTIIEQELAAHQIYPAKILEGFAHNSITYIREGNSCGILLDIFCSAELCTQIQIGEPFCTIHGVIAYVSKATLSVAAYELMQIIVREFS